LKREANETLVVMGVSGVGKTSVARALSAELPAHFIEADDFHSAENVKAMRAGFPLTDEMREPWLNAITRAVDAVHKAQPEGSVILACSALKRGYRDILRSGFSRFRFIHLVGERDVIAARLSSRAGHFFSSDLLDSQFATLESLGADESFMEIDVSKALSEVVAEIKARLSADIKPN